MSFPFMIIKISTLPISQNCRMEIQRHFKTVFGCHTSCKKHEQTQIMSCGEGLLQDTWAHFFKV